MWAYGAVFVGMLLESLGLPLPGQTLALVAAILTGQDQLNFWLVFLLTIAGGAIGGSGGYWLGRKGGRELLLHGGRYLRITPARLLTAEQFVAQHGYKTLLVSRYLPVLCFASGLLSGVTKLDFRRFWLANLFGIIFWSITHLTAGLFLGSSLHLLKQTLTGFGLIIFAGLLLAVLRGVLKKTKLGREARKR